jgi:predicted kinase
MEKNIGTKQMKTSLQNNLLDSVFDLDKPVFIMMCGIPSSGKTTLSQKLNAKSQLMGKTFQILGTDAIIESMAERFQMTYAEMFEMVSFDSVNTQFKIQVNEAVKQQENLIIDQTNVSFKDRKRKMSWLQIPDNYTKILMYFDLPESVWESRYQMRTDKIIPMSVVDKMKNKFAIDDRDSQLFDVIIDSETVEKLLENNKG